MKTHQLVAAGVVIASHAFAAYSWGFQSNLDVPQAANASSQSFGARPSDGGSESFKSHRESGGDFNSAAQPESPTGQAEAQVARREVAEAAARAASEPELARYARDRIRDLQLRANRLLQEAVNLEHQTDGPSGGHWVSAQRVALQQQAQAKRAEAEKLLDEARHLQLQLDEVQEPPKVEHNVITESIRPSTETAEGPPLAVGGSVLAGASAKHHQKYSEAPAVHAAPPVIHAAPPVYVPPPVIHAAPPPFIPPPDAHVAPPVAHIDVPSVPKVESIELASKGKPAEAASSATSDFLTESEKIDGLVQGSAAVTAPATAVEERPFTVSLRVSPDKLSALMQSLKADYPDNETIKGKDGVKLTPRMVATVTGFGFEVSPKDGQMQAVSATEPTTWEWQVNPTDSGKKTLTFTLAGTLNVEGKEVARNFYQYEQSVEVDVNPMGFVGKYWQWLATTLVIPAAGAIWAVLFRRPKDAETGQKQPSLAQKLRERKR